MSSPLESLVLNENVNIYTGLTEHTDLEDVDRAVAGFFKAVVSSLVVTDTERRETKSLPDLPSSQATERSTWEAHQTHNSSCVSWWPS